MLTLLVVQFVLVWHGTHVAQAAAQTAARTAAAYRADPGTGQAAGDAYLAEVAPNLLPGRTVTVHRRRRHGHRTVHAQVLTILPFAAFDIQETATAPRERFVENRRRAMTSRYRAVRGGVDRDRGSMTTELVVLAPIVIVLLLLVVGLGRYAHGKQLVEQAAAAAARAASLTSTAAQANTQAQRAAAGSLADAGVSCTGMTTTVDTGSFRPGGMVTVTITCTADLSDLALSGLPGTATFTATGRAVLGSSTGSSLIPEPSHDPASGSALAPGCGERDQASVDDGCRMIGIAGRSPPTC